MKPIYPSLLAVSLAVSLAACQSNHQDEDPEIVPAISPPVVTTTQGVGMTYFNIVDDSRIDTYGPLENQFRDIMVKVWYPADITENDQPVHMWYHTEEYRLPLEGYTSPNAPSYVSELLNTPSKSYLNATPSDGQSPVVFFSHGYWSPIEQNQYLMEHLVEQGYIVVSVGHNYQASVMTQADGVVNVIDWEIRKNDFDLAPQADVNADQLNAELEALIDVDMSTEQKDRVYQLTNWAIGDKQSINDWVLDTHKTLAILKQLNTFDETQLASRSAGMPALGDKFDFSKIAMGGGSFGGLNALDFCNQVETCKGAFNFDAQNYTLERNGNYHKPYMMQMADKGIYPMIKLIMEQQEEPIYVVEVLDAAHGNFSDSSIFKISPELGSINGQRMIDLMNISVTAFLKNIFNDDTSDQQFIDTLKQQPEFIITVDAD